MKTNAISSLVEQKLCIPADIVHITFPILCWALLAFRWCNLWLTEPWMTGVIVFYYALAAAYLVFTVIVRMRVIAIIGLFLTLAACFFMWIPYNWVLAILLVPALFMAFYKRGKKVAAYVLTSLAGVGVLLVMMASLLFTRLIPEKYTYHMSPDGHYAALEHAFIQFSSSTDVILYRAIGPLLVKERVLYLADYSDFGGKIEWIDESNIFIYDRNMDVIKDPTIQNYTPSAPF